MARGARVGPYEVVAELGRGAMGVVYRARHVVSGAEHALKVVIAGEGAAAGAPAPERALARFRREAEVLAKIDGHAGIVRVFAFGLEGSTPWCAMELIDAAPLSAKLGERMAPPDAARLVARAADAVSHAHRHGVLHRDIKPSNILVDRDGRPRMIDFGLAHDVLASRLSLTGEVVGTPAYMAPEQIAGEATRPETDVYALGAVLYECLTGRAPFTGLSGLDLLAAIAGRDPPPIRASAPHVPRELEAVCAKALAKDPAARYATAAELEADLDRWLAGEPVLARPRGRLAGVVRRLAFAPSRATTVAIALSIVAAAAVAGAWLLVRGAAESARREQAAAADRRRAFDEVFGAARRGDAAGIERALAMLRDDAAVREAAHPDAMRVLEGLAKLRKGDDVLVRTLSFDGPPWASHAAAVVAVLARGGHARALFTLLEREPALLAKVAPDDLPGIEESLVAALGAGGLDLSSRAADGLARSRAQARAADPGGVAKGALARIEATVLARRIASIVPPIASGASTIAPGHVEAMIAASDELARRIDALLAVTDRRAALAAVGERPASALAAFARAVKLENADARALWRIVAATLRLLGEDDPRLGDPIALLMGFAFNAQQSDDRDARGAGFEAGLMLYTRGSSWPWIHELGEVGRGIDYAALAEDARARGDADAMTALLELQGNEALAANAPSGQHVLASWAIVDALLRRTFAADGAPRPPEAEPPPPPAWAVGQLATELAKVPSASIDALPPERAEAVRRTLAEVGAAATRDGLIQLVDRMHGAAMRRWEDVASPWWRHQLLFASLEWTDGCAGIDAAHDGAITLEAVRRAARDARDLAVLRTTEDTRGGAWGLRHEALAKEIQALATLAVRGLYRRATSKSGGTPPAGELASWADAVDELAKAIEPVMPTSWVPDGLRALHHIRTGDGKKALEALKRGLARERLDAGSVDEMELPADIAWLLVATILADAGKREEARQALENVRTRKLGPLGLERRARIWERLGDPTRAKADRETTPRPRSRVQSGF